MKASSIGRDDPSDWLRFDEGVLPGQRYCQLHSLPPVSCGITCGRSIEMHSVSTSANCSLLKIKQRNHCQFVRCESGCFPTLVGMKPITQCAKIQKKPTFANQIQSDTIRYHKYKVVICSFSPLCCCETMLKDLKILKPRTSQHAVFASA